MQVVNNATTQWMVNLVHQENENKYQSIIDQQAAEIKA